MSTSNTRTIGRNSFWYGLETGAEFLVALGCSIAMARVIGPERLGYFNYIMWLCNTGGLVCALGVPMSMRKHMAECLGRGQPGLAGAIFTYAFHRQIAAACAVWVLASIGAFFLAAPGYRTVSLLLVGSMLANMLGMIPAQANAAAENLAANLPASMVGQLLFAIGVALSLSLGWGVLGIAAGILTYRWVELLVRLAPVLRWRRSLPATDLLPEMRDRVSSFSRQSLVLMILDLIVWNRSDLILLRWLAPDMAQLSYYSVAFNLAEKARLAPQVLGVASGVSLMAQYGRDPSLVSAMASRALKYSLMLALPLLAGLAGLSSVLIPNLYGREYLPAIPALALAAAFAVASVAMVPGQHLLQAADRQRYLILCTLVAGIVNVSADLLLIPGFGATGAVVGSGIGQSVAVIGIWWYARRQLATTLDGRAFAVVGVGALLTFSCTAFLATLSRSWWILLLAPPIGAAAYVGALLAFKPLDGSDSRRLEQLLSLIPISLRPCASRLLRALAH